MASKDKKAFLMRIDPKLWAELEQLAASNLRSINGQIEYMLRESIDKRKAKGATSQSVAPQAIKARR